VGIVIVVAVVVLVVTVVIFGVRSRGRGKSGAEPTLIENDRTRPSVAEFHVSDGSAQVRFNVPLAAGEIDAVLVDVLVREGIEVVRAKRNDLPLSEVHQVVVFGRRDGEWIEVGSVRLDTPGTLPPPMIPELLPHASRPGFDAFERISELPQNPPKLADRRTAEELDPMGPLVVLPQSVEAGIRAQGLDPDTVDACALLLGVMRIAGYSISEKSADTYDGIRHGKRVFLRTVCHLSTDHPELDERQVDRFVVDFVSSGADHGLLITEKFSPFEIYDRERREPRMRFITRERIQDFVDALVIG
jgi:hypothetical protein